MKSSLGAALALGLVLAAAAIWTWPRPSVRAPLQRASEPAARASPLPSTLPPAAPVQPAADMAVLQQTPEVRAWQERQAFEARTRTFFADAARLEPAARRQQAAALQADIDRYEKASQLSAGEAMNLRLGLIQAEESDEVERGARMAEIVAAYRQDGARREAQWQQALQDDAAFADYKRREQTIVAEVMALQQIPGGLSRDEYLRQRLLAERVASTR